MTPETVGVVRTRRLEVVDEDDVVRIVLYCQRDIDGDSAMVEVYDPKGSLVMDLSNDGEESIAEWWQRGNPVLSVRSTCEGLALVEIATPDTYGTAFAWRNDTESEGVES